ncbi:hypothetical protein ABZX62_07595 [Streptomyces flavidovirens]|uniref:hypothetical protein n=1 Tax=Streptomyces flavidovirens TaxID=67298 RepID=UPI0033BAC4E1
MNNFVQAMANQAIALNGQTVTVNLVGGSTLTGTLAYAINMNDGRFQSYPTALTVTVASKAHTVRMDHVSAIGQG